MKRILVAPPDRHQLVAAPLRRRQWLWLAASFPFAFALPFLLADTLDLNPACVEGGAARS